MYQSNATEDKTQYDIETVIYVTMSISILNQCTSNPELFLCWLPDTPGKIQAASRAARYFVAPLLLFLLS